MDESFLVTPLRISVVFAMSVVVAACAQEYVLPSAGPAAKLRYATNTDDRTQLTRLDTSFCPGIPQPQLVATTVGSILTQGAVPMIQMISSSEPVEGRVRELRVEADKPFVFKVEMGQDSNIYVGGYSCTVTGGFIPKSGLEYEMEFLRTERGCVNRIYRFSRTSDGSNRRTIDPTQSYFRVTEVRDYCRWQPPQEATVPQDIIAALQAGEVSQDSSTPDTGGAPKPSAAETATAEPGSDLHAALQAPQAPEKAGSNAGVPASDRRPPAVAPQDTGGPGIASTPTTSPPRDNARWRPSRGDTWRYRLIDGKRPVGTVSIEVIENAGSRVRERITKSDVPSFSLERDVQAEFIGRHFAPHVSLPGGYQLLELSAFLPPGVQIDPSALLSQVPGNVRINQVGVRSLTWSVRLEGREQVKVPAGEFEAWRIEASSNTNMQYGEARLRYSIWYAPSMRRAVKIHLATLWPIDTQSTFETLELAEIVPGK
jgi:hypothetical protein